MPLSDRADPIPPDRVRLGSKGGNEQGARGRSDRIIGTAFLGCNCVDAVDKAAVEATSNESSADGRFIHGATRHGADP